MGFVNTIRGGLMGGNPNNATGQTPEDAANKARERYMEQKTQSNTVFGAPTAWGPQSKPFERDSRFSMDQPGAAEQAYGQAQQSFARPGPGTEAMTQSMEGMGAPGSQESFWQFAMPGVVAGAGQDNPMNAAMSSFQANRPDLAGDPGLAPYYDDAKRRALESVNANAAARGAYGSSAALDQGTEAVAALEGQRAQQEADYALRQAAEGRAWEGLGGDLAGALSADRRGWTGMGLEGSAGAQNAEMSRLLNMAQTGQVLNADERARLANWMNAAGVSQQSREGRIQGGFDNMLGLGTELFAPTVAQMDKGYDTYLGGNDAYTQSDLATGESGVRASRDRQMRVRDTAKSAANIVGSIYGGKAGGAAVNKVTEEGGE